jgi:hypothetical protein
LLAETHHASTDVSEVLHKAGSSSSAGKQGCGLVGRNDFKAYWGCSEKFCFDHRSGCEFFLGETTPPPAISHPARVHIVSHFAPKIKLLSVRGLSERELLLYFGVMQFFENEYGLAYALND